MIRKGLVALLEARCLTGRISSKLHGSWGLLLHQTWRAAAAAEIAASL